MEAVLRFILWHCLSRPYLGALRFLKGQVSTIVRKQGNL